MPLSGELDVLLRIIIILSLRNILVCLNEINYWNKATQYKKHFYLFIYLFIFEVFLSCFFFAITPIATPLSYATESKEEERVDDT